MNSRDNVSLHTIAAVVLFVVTGLLVLTPGCSSDKATNSGNTNHPPLAPSSPLPANGATNQSNTPRITWQYSDPDNDLLVFEVYFGTAATPPFSVDLADTPFVPAQLAQGTTYYWKVVAKDNASQTSGPVWSFATVGNRAPAVPSNPTPQDSSKGLYHLYTEFAWSGSDPDGDPVTYDFYIGTDPNPPLAVSNVTSNTYASTQNDWFSNLQFNTLYYWKVVAKDDHGHQTSGPVWLFTTERDMALVGRYANVGSAWRIDMLPPYVYVADYGSAIKIVDVSNPSAPIGRGSIAIPGISDVAVAGTYVYAAKIGGAKGQDSIVVISVGDPANPYRVAALGIAGWPSFVSFYKGYLFVSSNWYSHSDTSRLEIIDVTNPMTPTRLARYDVTTNGTCNAVFVGPTYAYVGADNGMHILDVSDRANPQWVGQLNYPVHFSMSTGAGVGLFDGNVFDLTDRLNPVLKGELALRGGGCGLSTWMSGNTAYVAECSSNYSGVEVFDLSDLDHLWPVARYRTSTGCQDIIVVGDYVYVAGQEAGLLILQVTP